MATTKNIKYGSGIPTEKAAGQKLASLKTISTGVQVNKNYKKGKDPALDATLEKLKKDPSSLDSSGMGSHWKI